MASNASRIAAACALGFGFLLLWPAATPARDGRRDAAAFHAAQGQEVVNGSYYCNGTLFTDAQAANVSAAAYLYATSGITDGLYSTGQSSRDVPADLAAMAALCEAHVGIVAGQVPAICTLGEIQREQGEFGNGSSTVARFDFSCQGTRDEVIGVIGGFSRLALTVRLE
jgi:hypothetical protein